MSALDRELATMRGLAACQGDEDRLNEAAAELATLRELVAEQKCTIQALMVDSPDDTTTPVIARIGRLETERETLREQLAAAQAQLANEMARNTNTVGKTVLVERIAKAREDERERCAKWLASKAEAYAQEFAEAEPDTGAVVFQSEAHENYYNTVSELAEALRALPAEPAAAESQADCGNAECAWRGPIGETSMLGTIGPLCPNCREVVEPDLVADQPAQDDDWIDWAGECAADFYPETEGVVVEVTHRNGHINIGPVEGFAWNHDKRLNRRFHIVAYRLAAQDDGTKGGV
jgi:hypothetical protein